jgi:hypothetical protein
MRQTKPKALLLLLPLKVKAGPTVAAATAAGELLSRWKY